MSLRKIIILEAIFMAFEWINPLLNFIGLGINAGASSAQLQNDQQALALQAENNKFNQEQAQLNNAFQQEQFEYQKELNAQNRADTLALNAQQRSDQLAVNAQQQANWQSQFDYQKYLNANQTQISARDAALAGINPLAMTGNSVSAGNASSAGGVANGSVSNGNVAGGSKTGANLSSQVYGQGLSAMAQLGSNMSSLGLSGRQLKNQREIADAGNENAWRIAKLSDNAKMEELKLEREKWTAERELLSEQTKTQSFLNNYQEKNGTPYQFRNSTVDAITGILGLLNNYMQGKGTVKEFESNIVEALKGLGDKIGSSSSGPKFDPASMSDEDLNKMAEMISKSLEKKSDSQSSGFTYRYAK